MEQFEKNFKKPINQDCFYKTIFSRRDVRAQFTGQEIGNDTLLRILSAAHAAPSVGLSQPWDFIVIKDINTRKTFYEHVQKERECFEQLLQGDRKVLFSKLKIEGILDSTLSVVVTYDDTRGAPHVLGRNTIKDAGLYSVCLAIQNFWLAATYEGLGVGWVSFYREEFLGNLLSLPSHIRPIAWLCLGPVTHLEQSPDLEKAGWASRLPLDKILHYEKW